MAAFSTLCASSAPACQVNSPKCLAVRCSGLTQCSVRLGGLNYLLQFLRKLGAVRDSEVGSASFPTLFSSLPSLPLLFFLPAPSSSLLLLSFLIL
eukprot:3237366-Rhodomonas_salina.2